MHTHKCTTAPCTGTHRTRTLIARHGQDSTGRTQHEHAIRQLCKNPIQPSDAALNSAPGALSGPSQLEMEPTCETKAGRRHAAHDAAESLQDKGTQAVSTCACKIMGSGSARGSAHLGTRSSSSRRYLRRADVQRGQRSPLCSSACRRLCAVQCNLSRARARAPSRFARPCPASSGSPC